jgi:hypothetical protein
MISQKTMESVCILGGGRFGLKAAENLPKRFPKIGITIVEADKTTCEAIETLPFNLICMDGIAYLDGLLKSPDRPDWIIPAMPVHVVCEWIMRGLSSSLYAEAINVPEDLTAVLPNAIKGSQGQLYLSNADFTCPDNCPEPDETCTYTRKPRPRILYENLESIVYKDFRSVVIKSCQLVPGTGGFTPDDLFKARDLVLSETTPVLISTACKCHGVMNAVRFRND